MIKKVFITVFVFSLFFSSSCLAFDGNEMVSSILDWVSNDLKPFIESKLSEASKIEFEKEIENLIKDFPGFVSSIYNQIKELIK